VVGPPRLLLLVELARLAAREPGLAASCEALLPDRIGGDNRGGRVERVLHRRLEQQRHLDDRDLDFVAERPPPVEHGLADAGMELGFEPAQLVGALEHDLGDAGAVDGAVRRHLRTPALDQELADVLAVEEVVGDAVGREGGGAEPIGGGERLGLTSPDPTGKPDEASQRRTA
jgi:hypothetical protein